MATLEQPIPIVDASSIQNGVPSHTINSSEEHSTQSKKSPLDSEFEDIIKRTLDQWHIQGMSVAVIDGEETWSQGYGLSNFPNTPVQPSTLFYVGSITKAHLAAAVCLLVHDNDKYKHIQWDTPMNDLIRDDFVLEDDYATSHVTIEDALSHRTGLPGHTLTFGGNTLKESVRSLRHLYLNKAIRTTWQYSNLMYMAVSHMVEVVTGTSLADFLRERIWEPLSMNQTFFRHHTVQEYLAQHKDVQLATGYSWDKATNTAKAVPHWKDMVVSGAGAIVSNVVDFAKFTRSMIEQSGPLPNAAYQDLVTPRSIMPPFDPHFNFPLMYALGWIVGIYHGEKVIYHLGGLDGFSSTMMYLPDRKWGVVVFANAQSRGTEVPAWYLIDTLLGVPQEKQMNLFDWNEKALGQAQESITDAPSRLYPSAPKSPLPLPLPLSEYLGTYRHAAYRPFVIHFSTEEQPKLIAIAEGSVKVVLNLRHVTGNYFVADLVLFSHGVEPLTSLRAEFEQDIQGKVCRFGAELDFLSGGGTKIWFEKDESP